MHTEVKEKLKKAENSCFFYFIENKQASYCLIKKKKIAQNFHLLHG